jgi:hypothetical protein
VIEQLQSLMKALEAGSYNVNPIQAAKPMNLEFTIVDKDTGKIVRTGMVRSMSVEYSRHDNHVRSFRFEGIELIKIQREVVEPMHYLGRGGENVPKPQYFESKKCQHSWKRYEGFMDKYDYCEKCNEKRT